MRAACLLLLLATAVLRAQEADTLPVAVHGIVQKLEPALVQLYQDLHRHPEPPCAEKLTAERLAKELGAAGCEVTPGVGGHGLVAVLKNGEGPVVLVRVALDAQPVTEETGLPYASKERWRRPDGQQTGLMHACGHDADMAVAVGTARVLKLLERFWKGTAIIAAEGASPTGGGEHAMLAAGLLTKWPRPRAVLAFELDPRLPVGKVGYPTGPAFAGRDDYDVVVKGREAPAERPEEGVDPILLAADFVQHLQIIRSRELSPAEPVLISVGSVHGGSNAGTLAREVHLELTVRCFDDALRERIPILMRRHATSLARAAGLPDDRLPTITRREGHVPPVINDPRMARDLVPAFIRYLGQPFLVLAQSPPSMRCDDFAFIASQMPYNAGVFAFYLGCVAPETLAPSKDEAAPAPPSLGSPRFAPLPAPTLTFGTRALCAALLTLTPKEGK